MFNRRGINTDMDFPPLPTLFKVWIMFCITMGVTTFIGIAYVIYKVCQHFGIM